MDKIEITRSFSRKLNIGNYETVDFFASVKGEVGPEQKEDISQELFSFVKNEVEKSIKEYRIANVTPKEARKPIGIQKKPEYGKMTGQERYNERSEIEIINRDLSI